MDNQLLARKYIENRRRVLEYTYRDMNLALENNEQVYLAVFDIPTDSILTSGRTKTLALIFGLNTHIYFGNGDSIINLEKNSDIMKAMQSLFISVPQVLRITKLVDDCSFYESKNIRAYLKTKEGIRFCELEGKTREERFLLMLMNNVLKLIAQQL
ncbi:hypothetical protein CIY_00700 [Butyrivibrio fibrisolvens 16/4]|nr:hypothetical protein CIY_00700 [Butyrivibrio fibrisolvens 16/4]